MPPKRTATGRNKAQPDGDISDTDNTYGHHSDANVSEAELKAKKTKHKAQSKPATKRGEKADGSSNSDAGLNVRGKNTTAFAAAVTERNETLDELERKSIDRHEKITTLLNTIGAEGMNEKDKTGLMRSFTVRKDALDKLVKVFSPDIYAAMESKLDDAKTYFDDTRPRKIVETRKDIASEVERTQEKAATEAEIKERSRAMIRGIRDSMRVAAGERDRSRSFSESL